MEIHGIGFSSSATHGPVQAILVSLKTVAAFLFFRRLLQVYG